MSRGFGATYGVTTTDTVKTNYSVAPANTISLCAWVLINSQGGTAGRVFDFSNGSTVNFVVATPSPGTNVLFEINGSQTNATTLSPMSFGVWYHIAFVATSGGQVRGYLNGSLFTTTSTGTTTWTPSAQTVYIGNRSDQGRNFDGMIAHAAFWNGTLLSDAEVLSLGNGVSPLLIRPEGLSFYLPLDGVSNPEPDFVNGFSNTITGTRLGKSEPLVQPLPKIRRLFDYETASAAASSFSPYWAMNNSINLGHGVAIR